MTAERTAEVVVPKETATAHAASPATAGELGNSLNAFPWASVRVSTKLPEGFDDYPDAPDRIRGAVGRQLQAQPSRSDAGLLHRFMFEQDDGLDEARPFTIQCDRRGRTMFVTLNLAGYAANLIVVGCQALRHALAAGIRKGPDDRHRAALEPSRPTFHRHLGFDAMQEASEDRLHIRLLSPLSVRRGTAGMAGSLDTLPTNLVQRFCRLSALWHMPFDGSATIPGRLSDCLTPIDEDLFPLNYKHYSKNRAAPSIYPAVRGTVAYSGNHRCFLQLFRFGEVFHAGSGTALGLGRLLVTAS